MSAQANKAIVQRYIEEVLNQGKLAVSDENRRCRIRHASLKARTEARQGGRERICRRPTRRRPDWHITIQDMVAEGDKVAVRATGRGTPTREFFGIPASSGMFIVPWITIYRIADGKIAEARVQGDRPWLRKNGSTPSKPTPA